jgi:hypothetical protein
MSDGDLDRLRHEQDEINYDYDDTRVLIALLIMAVGIILATTGAQILRWIL